MSTRNLFYSSCFYFIILFCLPFLLGLQPYVSLILSAHIDEDPIRVDVVSLQCVQIKKTHLTFLAKIDFPFVPHTANINSSKSFLCEAVLSALRILFMCFAFFFVLVLEMWKLRSVRAFCAELPRKRVGGSGGGERHTH